MAQPHWAAGQRDRGTAKPSSLNHLIQDKAPAAESQAKSERSGSSTEPHKPQKINFLGFV